VPENPELSFVAPPFRPIAITSDCIPGRFNVGGRCHADGVEFESEAAAINIEFRVAVVATGCKGETLEREDERMEQSAGQYFYL
jgi:hypothetical protein